MTNTYERQANIRGLILRVLKDDPDQKLSDVAIAQAVSGYGYNDVSNNEIRREITFLKGRGYLSTEPKHHALLIVKLTDKGVDFLEGRVEDYAVNAPPV